MTVTMTIIERWNTRAAYVEHTFGRRRFIPQADVGLSILLGTTARQNAGSLYQTKCWQPGAGSFEGQIEAAGFSGSYPSGIAWPPETESNK